jgi:hypothetical protein
VGRCTLYLRLLGQVLEPRIVLDREVTELARQLLHQIATRLQPSLDVQVLQGHHTVLQLMHIVGTRLQVLINATLQLTKCTVEVPCSLLLVLFNETHLLLDNSEFFSHGHNLIL